VAVVDPLARRAPSPEGWRHERRAVLMSVPRLCGAAGIPVVIVPGNRGFWSSLQAVGGFDGILDSLAERERWPGPKAHHFTSTRSWRLTSTTTLASGG
jgi:hypothetical protein